MGSRTSWPSSAACNRSGTTPLTRWLGRHPGVSDFHDTGAFEEEGQHLQSVISTAGVHGGPGRFALDPQARLTEESELATAATRDALWGAWSPHWDLGRDVLIEKSPPNLIRTRFLQEIFGAERTYFLVVMRHPIAVTYATKKGDRSYKVADLMRHWLAGYEAFLDDAPELRNVLLLRYEELVAEPARELAKAFGFLGLAPYAEDWPAQSQLNDRYIERWYGSRAGPVPFKRPLYLRRLEREYEGRFAEFGYSLVEPRRTGEPASRAVARYLRR